MGGDRCDVGSPRGAKIKTNLHASLWKVRTKSWQRPDDGLKALKVRAPKEIESFEIVEEQD